MTLPVVFRVLAVLCFLTAAVVGFIDGFASNPLTYSWAVPIGIALAGAGLALLELSMMVKNPPA